MPKRYCDECQLPIDDCDTQCQGYIEREYFKAQQEWEQSPDWMETNPY